MQHPGALKGIEALGHSGRFTQQLEKACNYVSQPITEATVYPCLANGSSAASAITRDQKAQVFTWLSKGATSRSQAALGGVPWLGQLQAVAQERQMVM